MARTQQWRRNINKKIKRVKARSHRASANKDEVENFKRRAEGLGLLIHAQPKQGSKKRGGKQ